MKTVLRFSGKAKTVFRLLALLAKHKGTTKLGDLSSKTESEAEK